MRAKQMRSEQQPQQQQNWSKQHQLFNERLHAAHKQWEHVFGGKMRLLNVAK